MKNLRLYFGPLDDDLSEQLENQGLYLEKEDLLRFEKIIDGINVVWLHGVATDSVYEAMCKKLLKMIKERVKE